MNIMTTNDAQPCIDWAHDDHLSSGSTQLDAELNVDLDDVLGSIRESLGDEDERKLTIALLDEELDEYEQTTGVFMHVEVEGDAQAADVSMEFEVDEGDRPTGVFYRATPSPDDAEDFEDPEDSSFVIEGVGKSAASEIRCKRVTQQPADAQPGAGPDDTPTDSEPLGGMDIPAARRDRASVTVLTGYGAGAVVHIGSEELIVGRSRDGDVHFPDASISLRHARFFRIRQGVYFQDLTSDSGSRVGGIAVDDCVQLHDGDLVQLGDERVLRFNLSDAAEEEAAIALYESSVRDVTTGAFNRWHFDGRMRLEKAFAEQQHRPLWFMLIDVDDFEWVNTNHGHLVGDSVLRLMAATVQRNLLPADTLGRYGGDEFVVICPDVTVRQFELLAERIRADVERLPLCASGNDFHITVSIGITGGRSVDEARSGAFVDAADRAMYRAKRAGGNAVAAEWLS